jgi:hypothetical protein
MVFEMCRNDKKQCHTKDTNRTGNLTCIFSSIIRFDDLITERGYPLKSNQRGSLSKGFIAAAPVRSDLMYFSYVTLNCPVPAALWNLKIISAQSLQQSNKHN